MHRQLYAPPGAGKNFISYHVMWQGDESRVIDYNEQTNEYTVGSIKSELFDTNYYEKHFKEALEWESEWSLHQDKQKYELIQQLIAPVMAKMTREEFFQICRESGCSTQAWRVFENSWGWLPVIDYSLWYTTIYNKGNTRMDRYLEECLRSCTRIHRTMNRDIACVGHYPLHENLLVDISSMNIDIGDCEEWISDLFHVKQRQQPGGLNKRFFIVQGRDPDAPKAKTSVSYRKLFFEQDEKEIKRLYSFFGTQEHFIKNKDKIVREFRDYHEFNQRVIDEYDFTQTPGYEVDWDTYLANQNKDSAWRKKQEAKKTF